MQEDLQTALMDTARLCTPDAYLLMLIVQLQMQKGAAVGKRMPLWVHAGCCHGMTCDTSHVQLKPIHLLIHCEVLYQLEPICL